ncbi:MAG TPA: bifunctional demethylmenaquinone methyltransferase/2-methoxy-6-polyprenyl-1,4-benzoquinol methylase UbiE [Gallionella sp.]|nr:bifunctional demethylmenaquinone methyltransferase/2-methoxy-6-polyprenyl-1,4-benzoquinol methylase UbiE [Gallionella sp.]
MDKTTHFGFETVDETEKAKRVAGVFTSVASNYDIMNDLMSVGLHRLWKRFAVGISGVRAGQRVLDVAGGSADLTRLFFKKLGNNGQVVLTDINNAMLRVGRDRLLNEGINTPTTQCDAEHLPFPDNYFDCVSIAFGLRNITHKDAALNEMRRVLKPGGRLVILEFSKVAKPLEKIYDLYSFKLLPKIGELVAHDGDSYRYLAESIRMHPGQEELKAMMEAAGLEKVEYFNMTGGVVAVHRGYKF